ncbi:MFS transporter [Streptomyces albireticuli]|nr:MFS transporter [Streptomyces albireticuli]MCD9196423.1 MFS transporter [Streptomyces albireticuli]
MDPERAAPRVSPPGSGHRWPRAATVALCLGFFVLGTHLTVLDVAVPALRHDLGATLAQSQWIVGGYALVLGVSVLAAGAVADRAGRRRSLVAGLALCGAVSALGALARHPGHLIAARCGMGLGAALLTAVAFSLLGDLHRGAAARCRASTAGAVAGVAGGLTGPAVGGLLVEAFSWRAAFWIDVPLTAVALALVLALVPASRAAAPGPARTDFGGLVLSAAGFLALVLAFVESPARGWTAPAVLTGYGAAAVLLACFAGWERRTRHPVLPPSPPRDARVSTGAACLVLMSLVLFGALFVLILSLQAVRGCSPWQAGALVLPLPAALAVGAGAAQPLLARFGERLPVVLGLTLLTCAFAVQAGTRAGSGYGRVVTFELVAGLGAGLVAWAATETVMGAVPRERPGLGPAVHEATRQLGAALGVAVQGSVLSTVCASRLGEGAGDAVPLPLATPSRGAGALPAVAREAFAAAVATTAMTAAVISLVATTAAWYWLPAGRAAVADGTE